MSKIYVYVGFTKVTIATLTFDLVNPKSIGVLSLVRAISTSHIQETTQCDETRFSTIQPSIDMTGIRNERGPLFKLHWLHAPGLVSIGQNQLKLLSGN